MLRNALWMSARCVPPQLKCDSTPLQLWSTEESNESREEPREAPPVYS